MIKQNPETWPLKVADQRQLKTAVFTAMPFGIHLPEWIWYAETIDISDASMKLFASASVMEYASFFQKGAVVDDHSVICDDSTDDVLGYFVTFRRSF